MKVFLYIFLFCSTVSAKSYKVTKLRGIAFSGQNKLEVNANLKEGEIISTGPQSFILIREQNGGKITLGPESKIKLNKEKNLPLLIDLYKGEVRAHFKREKVDKGPKLYIRTRTGSAAVRGTDFHLVYNEKNGVTTSLAYSGEVTVRPFRDDKEFEEFKNNPKQLSDQNYQVIKKGKFSNTLYGNNLTSNPKKISPLQFNLLKKRDPFVQEIENKHILKNWRPQNNINNSQGPLTKNITLSPISLKEGRLSESHLNPGGYIDFKTGLYISPSSDDQYKKADDVYIPSEKIGGVNLRNGEYVPPPGFMLDPLSGFISLAEIVKDSGKYIGKKMADGTIYTATMLKNGILYSGEFIGNGIVNAGKELGGILTFGSLKLKDGVIFGGELIGSGVIEGGKLLKNGLIYAGGFIKEGVVTGAEVVTDTFLDSLLFVSTKTLDGLKTFASTLNEHIYDNFIKQTQLKLKKNKYFSKLGIGVETKLYYDPRATYPLFNEIHLDSKSPTLVNDWKINTSFKQLFPGKIYVDPFVTFFYKNHLRDNYAPTNNFDRKDLELGTDIGIGGIEFLSRYKVALRFERFNQWKYNQSNNANDKFISYSLYSLKGHFKFNSFIEPLIQFGIGKYDAHGLLQGNFLKGSLHQIIQFPFLNQINFSYHYTKRDQRFNSDEVKGNEFKIIHMKKLEKLKSILSTTISYKNLKYKINLDKQTHLLGGLRADHSF